MADPTNPPASQPQSAATQAATKEENDRRAREQAQSQGATDAARSLGDAVKRFTDAAVNEISKTGPTSRPDLIAAGSVGGSFEIVAGHGGVNFGASGTVLMGNKQVFTNGWSTTRIEGKLPPDAKSGEITVWVDPQTQYRGYINL